MSSYFDEHDCLPLSDGAAPDQLLQFARFLVTSGHWNHQEFSAFFSDRPPPPTSKQFMENLPRRLIREDTETECPICLKRLEQDEELLSLPCSSLSFKRSILQRSKVKGRRVSITSNH